VHIDDHEMDCMPFHRLIDHSSITFATKAIQVNDPVAQQDILTFDNCIALEQRNSYPSRAPPFNLV
jgi:hypothetical protein